MDLAVQAVFTGETAVPIGNGYIKMKTGRLKERRKSHHQAVKLIYIGPPILY